MSGVAGSALAYKLLKTADPLAVTLGATLSYSALFAYLSLVRDPVLFVAGFVVPVWCFFLSGELALASELSYEDSLGENLGALNAVAGLAALATLLLSPVMEAFGIDASLLLCSLACLASSPILVVVKRIRGLGTRV